MPFHRPCEPIAYSLSVPDPHRIIHRLTADHVDTTVTFSIPPGPWTVFMFAAVDANGSLTEPFSVSWSSTPLLPRQWYTVPTAVSNAPTELQISHGSSYGIIILLAGSQLDGSLLDGSEPESKPLTH
jgi:hypothetical protein